MVHDLRDYIRDGNVNIIGPIRQELLSGITDRKQFKQLKNYLSYFEDLPIKTEIYVLAAEFHNTCRGSGIQGSHIDFLICAVSVYYNLPIFTLDKDFDMYANLLDIKLYTPK